MLGCRDGGVLTGGDCDASFQAIVLLDANTYSFQTANLTEVELVLDMCYIQNRRIAMDKLISFLNRSSSGSLNKWKRSRDS